MDSNIVYKIEEILKRRKRHGVPEVLVKWKGWPVKFNSWITESDLQDINCGRIFAHLLNQLI